MVASRSIVFEKNKFYHIYNRGCNKQQLFFNARDYNRFYNNIDRFKIPCPHIQIVSWCFLPNHFHFLLLEQGPDSKNPDPKKAAEISIFMRKLQQAYAVFFNTKYRESVKQGKKGPVFEGNFKAKAVEDEDYLFQLKRYIEWNAVKHAIVEKPEEWEYSSYASKTYEDDLSFNGLEFNPYFE